MSSASLYGVCRDKHTGVCLYSKSIFVFSEELPGVVTKLYVPACSRAVEQADKMLKSLLAKKMSSTDTIFLEPIGDESGTKTWIALNVLSTDCLVDGTTYRIVQEHEINNPSAPTLLS